MREAELVQAVVEALRDRGMGTTIRSVNLVQNQKQVPVGVSARHAHLAAEHIEILFGKGYELTPTKDLQPGQFACQETVTLVGPKRALHNVRVLGPARSQSQVEVSVTDCYALGVEPVLRASGDLKGSPGVAVVGPQGAFYLTEGVIVAWRHVHMTPDLAKTFGVKDAELIKAKAMGNRGLVFDQILVRVSAAATLELHIDTDEANAAGLESGDEVELIC
jgi:putative phosphotransacetylase